MNKRRNKKMSIAIGVLLCIVGIIMVFFNISYSKTKAEFTENVKVMHSKAGHENDVFTEEDIAELPSPVQKYFRFCGFIGIRKMSYMKATYKDVDFSLKRGNPTIKIDYTQFNTVNKPMRIAYIDSSLYGIPFQGLDSYVNGVGSMKGVLAKFITLFDVRGHAMNKSSLVNCLSECLIIPSVALQDYITWEEIDDLHAKATISYFGISASGIFTFRESGEMLSFTTNDREAASTDGTSEKLRWTVLLDKYQESNGLRMPTVLQAVWHYDDGDYIYFNGKNVVVEYEILN